ncbi:MAG: 5-dehydro-4-deoxy-D-glucuronate isomerase, partial [Thermoanaerobaculia bacterium]
MQYFPNAAHARTMNTDELRSTFLLTDLFRPGEIDLRITDLDRAVVGGAVPLAQPLTLEAHPDLKAG